MANLSEFGLVSWEYADPPLYESLWFEKLDGNYLRYWTKNQMTNVWIICGFYLLFVWLGPLWMKHRKPFNLQKPLIIWNALLAIFSIIGAARSLPEFLIVVLGPNGFHRSACVVDSLNHPTSFWAFAFTLSKMAELVDTGFIILRKKPLMFLHWFHHLTMAIGCFHLFPEGEPYGRWVACLNFSVHSIMYSYYTIKAMNIKVPKRVSKIITSLQIGQFLIGLTVNMYTAYLLGKNADCFRTRQSVTISGIIGSAYLLLFMKFFYNAYLVQPKTKKN